MRSATAEPTLNKYQEYRLLTVNMQEYNLQDFDSKLLINQCSCRSQCFSMHFAAFHTSPSRQIWETRLAYESNTN